MFNSNSHLQDFKIANDWAYSELQKAAGAQRSKPEKWAFVNDRYNTTKRLFEEAINEFIVNEMKLAKEVEAHKKAMAEQEAEEALLSDSEREKLREEREENEKENWC